MKIDEKMENFTRLFKSRKSQMEVIEMQNAAIKITNLIRGHNSRLDRE